jgi:hypothetical protein
MHSLATSSTTAATNRAVPDTVRFWLRIEGLAAFLAGAAIYAAQGGDWLWFVPLLLLPDVAIAGYAGGSRLGAFAYNLVHNWATGLALLALGLSIPATPVIIAGAILVAHVGMDRAAGYGLKHIEGFKDTHLQRA